MQKYLFLFVFILGSQWMIAQNDDTQDTPIPANPFDELLNQFDISGQGNGIFMDTMIIKQFGDLGFSDADLQESMQEMMKMFEQQFQNFNFDDMQGFNFGNMQDLNKLFEGFDLDAFPPLQDLEAPPTPDEEGEDKEIKTKKKRKKYKL